MVTLRPYTVPGFWTVLGALAKVRQLERRGFPSIRNWRFVTLTVDRSRYPDPEQADEVGTRHLREFIYQLRKQYGIRRWCWKKEFHETDDEGRTYTHFHLLLDYKRTISRDDIDRLWGKGRINIQCVRSENFDYVFKYVTKAVSELPEWVLNRTRMRLFQTSKGFFATDGEREQSSVPSPRQCGDDRATETENDAVSKKETIGERIQRWSSLVVSRTNLPDGTVRHRLHAVDGSSWSQLLVAVCNVKFAEGLRENVIRITSNKIETTCLQVLPSFLPM